MLVSILHRVTGVGLATLGATILVWWLFAAASGADYYATVHRCLTGWVGVVIGVGLTWAVFQHMLSGMRHLVLDTGAGFELRNNKVWSTATIVGSIVLTALVWALILQ